jgi:hypothetical protein
MVSCPHDKKPPQFPVLPSEQLYVLISDFLDYLNLLNIELGSDLYVVNGNQSVSVDEDDYICSTEGVLTDLCTCVDIKDYADFFLEYGVKQFV